MMIDTRAELTDAVSMYFSEIGGVPLLTAEEEVALAKTMEAGHEAQEALAQNALDAAQRAELEARATEGKAARALFIKANTRLVVSIAKRYIHYGLPLSDLIQAGNVGLITAVDHFDYHKGNRFSTYGAWWIRQAITRSLTKHGRTIRLPAYINQQLGRLRRVRQQLTQRLGRRPPLEEIAEAMDMPPDKLRRLLRISQRSLSLNAPVGEGDEIVSLIEDQSSPSPLQRVQKRMMREDLLALLAEALSAKELQVLEMRFGLRGRETHTLAEIAELIHVSRERVRQIERKAIRKLRHPLHRHKLEGYLP
ncbi:MAG: sigma-70 family RNA polymerase sigma factor [Anaerolineae bacterium]|nr:sigma-70 family RNA polymerase sigma factor [Anaerolineae bacterium]